LTSGGIVMITPLDDLTESGYTLITYCCTPASGYFIISLNAPNNLNIGGTTVGFGTINSYHSFMYNVVAL